MLGRQKKQKNKMPVLGAVYVKLDGLAIPSKTSLAKQPMESGPTHNEPLDFPLSGHYKFYNPLTKQSPIETMIPTYGSSEFLQLLPLTTHKSTQNKRVTPSSKKIYFYGEMMIHPVI